MKSFLAACGIEDSFQFAVENQDATESRLRLLYQPFAVVGRDLRADVVLDHAEVSRRHVYLQVIDGRVFWMDLESRTGTRGERESQRTGWLEGGRRLCIGPYVIRRFTGDNQTVDKLDRGDLPRDTPLIARPSAHPAQSEVALEFLNGPSQSMLKPVHRVLSLIGSASGCKFRLTDSSVSRVHASLLQTSAGLWIVDLLGQKGVIINDVPVRCSRLVDGDVVRIGRYQVRIRYRPRAQRSGIELFDLGRGAFLPKVARQNRMPIGLNSTRWAPTIASGEANSKLSKDDLVPTNSIVPVNLPQSELTESMLVPLVNQFGLMQQQMFDQFQQAMAMMVQMFGTMHRDQMEVIRAELDRLREVTDEFHALKNELAERTREKAEPELGESEFNAAGLDRSHVLEPNSPTVPPSKAEAVLQGSRQGRAPAPSPQPTISRTIGQQSSPDPHVVPTQSTPGSLAGSSIPELTLKTGSQASGEPSATSTSPGPDRDTVLWLHQRIMVLQNERENRWQRILKLMPGMSSS